MGLAADCDRPERDVEQMMRANLAGASTLPFVGFVTHDGKWVGGFSGHKSITGFLDALEKAEKTPYLQASKATRKKLAKLLAAAEKAAKRKVWKAVLRATNAAQKTTGRCPERKALAGLLAKARSSAARRFDTAISLARSGGDLKQARTLLSTVKKQFGGEPEAKQASTGIKALAKLARIVEAEAGESPPAGARKKAAGKYKGTRWATIFDKSAAAAKADDPEDNEDTDEDGDDDPEIDIGDG